MKRFWCLCVVLMLFVGSGCTDEKGQVYPYFIGIDEYRSGSSLVGPMLYLQSLGIQDQFTVETQDDRQVADSKAAAVFETEMSKVDPVMIESFEGCYVRYVLLAPDSTTLQQCEFRTE